MQMTAHYQLVLHPGVESVAFEKAVTANDLESVLQLTRVTSAFAGRLLRVGQLRPSEGSSIQDILLPGRQYVWEVTATLVGSGPGGYRFDQNLGRLQDKVADFATVIGVDSFFAVDTAS